MLNVEPRIEHGTSLLFTRQPDKPLIYCKHKINNNGSKPLIDDWLALHFRCEQSRVRLPVWARENGVDPALCCQLGKHLN